MRNGYMTGGGSIQYPDEIVFANMPQLVQLVNFRSTEARVQIAGVGSFAWRVVNNKATLNLQAFVVAAFGDMRGVKADDAAKRSRSISVQIRNVRDEVAFSFSMVAIWGALEPYERTAHLGAYAFDEEQQQWRRTLRWFSNFPTAFETIAASGGGWQVSNDGGAYGPQVAIGTTGILQINPAQVFAGMVATGDWLVEVTPNDINVFDATFDATFTNVIALYQQVLHVIKDTRKCGHFLRWVDRQGLLQSYLFDKGTESVKASEGEALHVETEQAGIYYPNIVRSERQGIEKSRKVCASLVPEEEARVVQSIGTAAICDLFVGYSDAGVALWLPVNVKAGTLTISERGGLQDVEVTIEVPTADGQKL